MTEVETNTPNRYSISVALSEDEQLVPLQVGNRYSVVGTDYVEIFEFQED